MDSTEITTAAGGDERVPLASIGMPDRIDRYKILEPLGTGGFGDVYLAEQTEPVRRRVALKVIKPGMDSRQVLARFEAERQALAVMDHPCIARVFDGGVTSAAEGSRSYFVMEHIDGVPITDYCDDHTLSVEARLELFIRVCEAVQHAHTKGVIHRDLKPSNILVVSQDGEHVPKVIDFGIAKALNARLTEATLHTQQGVMIGTPDYMSPEQAGTSTQDVDTRADVYALGVILYELLTGSRPFENSFRKATVAEIQRILRDVEPQRPSTRVASVEMSGALASRRGTDVRSLSSELKRDLDWVVMKCLEKDRSRRYDTASAVAMEVRRYLADEPVLAGPPGARYRLEKFAQRHRSGVLAAGMGFLLVIGGLAGTSFGLLEARRESRRADERATAAGIAEAQASARAEELRQVADFQSERLGAIDPELMGRRLLASIVGGVSEGEREVIERGLSGVNFTDVAMASLKENLLDATIEAIDTQFSEQPLVQAQLLQSMADTMTILGLLDRAMDPQQRALELRRRELGNEHPMTLRSLSNMGMLLQERGEFEQAEEYAREDLALCLLVFGEDHQDTFTSMNNLGLVLQEQSRLSEAEEHFRRALEGSRRLLGDEHPDTLVSLSNMGYLFEHQGKLAEAEPYYRETLETRRRVFGDDHPDTLVSLNNMGTLHVMQGRLADAEVYLGEGLASRRRMYGDDHPDTLLALSNMGFLLNMQGNLQNAEACYREALELRRRVLGDDHLDTLTTISNLALVLADLGRGEEALRLADEAVDRGRVALGPNHWLVGNFFGKRGRALQTLGRFADAESAFMEGYEVLVNAVGEEHGQTVRLIGYMVDLHKAWHVKEPDGGHEALAAEWERQLE